MAVKKTRKPKAKRAPTKRINKSQSNIGKGPNININIDQSKKSRTTRRSGGESTKSQQPIIISAPAAAAPTPIFNFPLPTNLNPFQAAIQSSQQIPAQQNPINAAIQSSQQSIRNEGNELEKPKPKEENDDGPPPLREETAEEKLTRIFKGNTPPPNPFKMGQKKEMTLEEELKAAVGGKRLKKTKEAKEEPIEKPDNPFLSELKSVVENKRQRKKKQTETENQPVIIEQPLETEFEKNLKQGMKKLRKKKEPLIEGFDIPPPTMEEKINSERQNDTPLEEISKQQNKKVGIYTLTQLNDNQPYEKASWSGEEMQYRERSRATPDNPFFGSGQKLVESSNPIERLTREQIRNKRLEAMGEQPLILTGKSEEAQQKEKEYDDYRDSLTKLSWSEFKNKAREEGLKPQEKGITRQILTDQLMEKRKNK